jgi:hypothetical protein
VRPVFVDASGRRQRRVLRAARLLVVPAGGYVALLISTMLGGPGVSAPFVPQPDAAHPAAPSATAPDSPPATARSAGSEGVTAAHAGSRPTARQTASAPAGRTAAPTARAAAPGPAAPASGPTATQTPAPTATHSSKGRALGQSHKPVK